MDIYSENVTHKYYKGGMDPQTYERNGTAYSMVRNQDLWVVVWTTDNMECSIAIDCPEEILLRILDSIHTMEEL